MAVLGKREMLRRLGRAGSGSEEIFCEGTWDCLRGAAYDLRVARDYLITPEGTRYWPAGAPGYQELAAPFTLEPGQVAFVSSVEVLCMPHDLSGNIATRFRRALEGILVMGGMLVDPGYVGRLHFQLANIGDKPFEVTPGKTSVAAVQFLPVKKPSRHLKRIPSSNDLLEKLFYADAKEPLPPLAFFSNIGDLRVGLAKLERRVDDQRIELDSTKRSTDQLLVFGVFLVSITLFTVAVAALIDALANGSLREAADTAKGTELTLPGIAVGVVLLAVVGLACWLMMRPVARIARRSGGGGTSISDGSEDQSG